MSIPVIMWSVIILLMTEDVQLIFAVPENRRDEIQEVGFQDKIKEFFVKTSDINKWFKDYEVKQIELWLEGGVTEGNLTKLFVSFEGKGGCKVTLKPKEL